MMVEMMRRRIQRKEGMEEDDDDDEHADEGNGTMELMKVKK